MVKFNKKGESSGENTYKYLIALLLTIIVATALYFIIRRIGNAFIPK